MAVNKPLLPRPPFAPGTFQGDQSRAIERELQKLQLSVKQLRDGRIEGVLALDAAPAGGVWAQGDVVQSSAPTRTISASTTFVVWGWQYTDEGAGTLTWAEMRFWESMAAGGGGSFAATSMTATTTGVGDSIYAGNAAGELTFRNLQAGTDISITVSGGAVKITSTAAVSGGSFAATSQTATHTGTGVGVYVGNAAGELTFRKVQAGTGISVTTSGGAIRITSTGGGGVSVTAGGGGVSVTTVSGLATIGLGASVSASVFVASDYIKVGADQVVGSRKDTWSEPTGTKTRTTFNTDSVTTKQLAEAFYALWDDLRNHGLIGTSLSVAIATSWNPSDKGSSQTLTNSNLLLASTGSWGGVRSARSQFNGDRYYEVVITTEGAAAGYHMIGVAGATASLETYLGAAATAWVWQCGTGGATKWNNNSSAAYGGSVSTSFTNGDVIGVRMNIGTGVLTFYYNGVDLGAAYTITASQTLFAAAGCYNNAQSTARFSSTSWSYAPSGVVQW